MSAQITALIKAANESGENLGDEGKEKSPSREDAIVDLEQRLLGWQIRGAPGVSEVVQAELRHEASCFQVPYNRVQEVILKALDEGRSVTVLGIAADLADYGPLAQVGGTEHLQGLAFAAPVILSVEHGARQAAGAIRAWRRHQNPAPKVGDVELVRADAIAPARIEWVWPGWLAEGKFHLIAGSPGTGKTTICLSVAATITNAGLFPCGRLSEGGSVLMWTGEDDLADSIIPRFLACGGDRERLHFVKGVRGLNGSSCPFDPARDMDRLIAKAKAIKDLKLLILDPVVSAVVGDSHNNAETRCGLQPLVDFAAAAGVAILGVTHFSKGTAGRDPAERVTGSLAFTAVPRLVMATAKPKEEGELWRLVRVKSNIGPDGDGFEYNLAQVSLEGGAQGQCVLWGSCLEGNAQTLLAEVEAPDEPRAAPAQEAAKVWLAEFLGRGAAAQKAVQQYAAEKGHKWATVRRAAKTLGVVSEKAGLEGCWMWRMPKVLKAEEEGQLAA
jgi:putative DNA primase/helicase